MHGWVKYSMHNAIDYLWIGKKITFEFGEMPASRGVPGPGRSAPRGVPAPGGVCSGGGGMPALTQTPLRTE